MLIVALSCALAAATPPATLVLPTDGAEVLPAIRSGVDDALRYGLTQRLGDALFSAESAEAILADAVAAGLSCSPKELSCATRIGIVAGAGEILIPTVRQGDGRLTVSVVRVDVGRAAALGVAAGAYVPADPSSLDLVLTTLMVLPATITLDAGDMVGDVVVDGAIVGALPLIGPLATLPGPHVVAVLGPRKDVLLQRNVTTRPGHQHLNIAPTQHKDDDDRASSTMTSPVLIGGWVAMGAGGLLMLAGTGGALLSELELNTPNPDDSRVQEVKESGVLLVGVALVGAAVVGVGGAMALLGSEQ
jgi:hypothetical protein